MAFLFSLLQILFLFTCFRLLIMLKFYEHVLNNLGVFRKNTVHNLKIIACLLGSKIISCKDNFCESHDD